MDFGAGRRPINRNQTHQSATFIAVADFGFTVFSMVRRHWLPRLALLPWGWLVSFLPIALMNVVYSRDWLGRSVLAMNLEVHRPLVGLAGNAFQLLLDNFAPHGFPARSLVEPARAAVGTPLRHGRVQRQF